MYKTLNLNFAEKADLFIFAMAANGGKIDAGEVEETVERHWNTFDW